MHCFTGVMLVSNVIVLKLYRRPNGQMKGSDIFLTCESDCYCPMTCGGGIESIDSTNLRTNELV